MKRSLRYFSFFERYMDILNIRLNVKYIHLFGEYFINIADTITSVIHQLNI